MVAGRWGEGPAGLQNHDTADGCGLDAEAVPQPTAWPLRESVAAAKHFAFLESSHQERDQTFAQLGFAEPRPAFPHALQGMGAV